MLALLAACGSPAPRPLAYEVETCAHCQMTLSDRRFGGEVVLRTGRAIPFDDAGCLATWLASEADTASEIASTWVTSFLPPHDLLESSAAVFLISDSLHTPMDYHLAGLPPGPRADSLRRVLGGELVSWNEVRAKLAHPETSR